MTEPLDTVVSIETPEHIVFQHRVAGPARRAMAHVVDLILCYTAVTVLAVLVGLAFLGAASLTEMFGDTTKIGVGLILIALFCAQWVWFVVWEGLRGSTPGKKAFGLRVVTVTGRPIGLGQAMLRNVLRVADLLPTAYLAGVASMALSKRFQRIGDLVAGTLVVNVDRAKVASANVLWPPPQPWEVAALPADVALDADERAAIELFLRRRGALGHAREHELASMIAAPLAKRLGWQGPVLDPVRTLALLYDRAANTGRGDAPVSSRAEARIEGAR
jgi:uncharacterized RDD family membrane protein YckC